MTFWDLTEYKTSNKDNNKHIPHVELVSSKRSIIILFTDNCQ